MDNGLIYGLEDRPPLKDTLFAALQHLLAIFVAIITPPLIVAGALGLDIETTSYLVSMSLFVSGIVVTLIGMSLIKVGITSCGGGNAAIEAYGDITANSLISGEPMDGEKFLKRAQGGILADGVNSFLAGMLNSFPNSIFAQNNGMIQLTGVASRYVGYFIALFLVLLGFFPIVGVVFSFMPDPVLGGATLLMFGTVASAGVKIIFSSGITTGGLAAIISNMIIRIKEDQEQGAEI